MGWRSWCGVVALLAAVACTPALPPSAGPLPAVVATVPPPDAAAASQSPQVDASEEPQAADTPAGLAKQIVAVEDAIRSDLRGARMAHAGHLQQNVYRLLAARPRWDARVLARVPRRLRPTVRAIVAANRELMDLSGKPPKDLPPWRIVAPAPHTEYLRYYKKAQRRFGVPWQYLAAIHLVETRMSRIRGDSVAGAQGPMQFIPSTWEIYGRGDVRDNHDAIMAAGRYLRARGAPRDMDRALFSYNNDVRYVRAVKGYASTMFADPRAYRGYYHWQVYYAQPGGAVWLPVGYDGRKNNR
jgi:membrane-bound lytic murein transglycosylase B